jgi:hypothetical protein
MYIYVYIYRSSDTIYFSTKIFWFSSVNLTNFTNNFLEFFFPQSVSQNYYYYYLILRTCTGTITFFNEALVVIYLTSQMRQGFFLFFFKFNLLNFFCTHQPLIYS